MRDTSAVTEKLTLRWPTQLCEKVRKISTKMNISENAVIAKAFLDNASVDNWIIRGARKEVMEIVKWAEENAPQDLVEAVEEARIRLSEEIILEG